MLTAFCPHCPARPTTSRAGALTTGSVHHPSPVVANVQLIGDVQNSCQNTPNFLSAVAHGIDGTSAHPTTPICCSRGASLRLSHHIFFFKYVRLNHHSFSSSSSSINTIFGLIITFCFSSSNLFTALCSCSRLATMSPPYCLLQSLRLGHQFFSSSKNISNKSPPLFFFHLPVHNIYCTYSRWLTW